SITSVGQGFDERTWRRIWRGLGVCRTSKHAVLLFVVQVELCPKSIGGMGNVCVLSDGSKRILVHHFSRACQGHRRWDLWSSDLLLRTDHGLLASAEGTATFRSCAQSSQRARIGGPRRAMPLAFTRAA